MSFCVDEFEIVLMLKAFKKNHLVSIMRKQMHFVNFQKLDAKINMALKCQQLPTKAS